MKDGDIEFLLLMFCSFIQNKVLLYSSDLELKNPPVSAFQIIGITGLYIMMPDLGNGIPKPDLNAGSSPSLTIS